MNNEKPWGWKIWHTVEEAKKIALDNLKKEQQKREQEKIRNKINWALRARN